MAIPFNNLLDGFHSLSKHRTEVFFYNTISVFAALFELTPNVCILESGMVAPRWIHLPRRYHMSLLGFCARTR